MKASDSAFDTRVGFRVKLSDEDTAAVGTAPRGRRSSWALATFYSCNVIAIHGYAKNRPSHWVETRSTVYSCPWLRQN